MARIKRCFLILGLALAAIQSWGDPAGAFAEGHVIVRFKPDRITNVELGAKARGMGLAELSLGLPEGSELIESGFSRWRQQGRKSDLPGSPEAAGAWDSHFLLHLPPGRKATDVIESLRQNPFIEYAEPDYIATAAGSDAVIPTDPDFPLQWHHHNPGSGERPIPADIQSVRAWAIARGSSNVVVAVLDTGCNGHLAEFSGRMIPGYDFVNRDSDPSDDNGHGTEVAGVLGANGDNGLLVAGVDWHCKIMPVKVLASDKSGLFSTLADGIDWAVAQGAHVISLSAGGTQSNLTLSNAVMRAISHGVVFVAAVHNDGGSIRFPARMPGVIAVGATTALDRRASFSNFGPELSLVAPGTNIYTVGRFGLRQVSWGTSMSAPQVAGAAALLLSIRPELNPEQVRELLCAGADDQVGLTTQDTPGFDTHHGFGRLNLHASLLLAGAGLEITRETNFVQLSWRAPANSEVKRPFEIQFAGRPDGPWQPLSDSPRMTFSEGRGSWVDDGSETGSPPALEMPRFYRLRIRK
jgi:thermitase